MAITQVLPDIGDCSDCSKITAFKDALTNFGTQANDTAISVNNDASIATAEANRAEAIVNAVIITNGAYITYGLTATDDQTSFTLNPKLLKTTVATTINGMKIGVSVNDAGDTMTITDSQLNVGFTVKATSKIEVIGIIKT